MKKLMKSLVAFMTCALLVVPTLATEGTFVPSITYKGSPEVVAIATEGDQLVVGYIVDGNGTVLSTVYDGCILVTSLEEALDSESEVPADIRKSLVDAYNGFLNGEIKLSEECPELNDVVAAALGEGNTADNLVVRDLFDITVPHTECNDELVKEGNTVDITYKVDIEKGEFIAVVQYVNGEWKMVEKVVNNNDNDITTDDGTITVTFEDFCPVAILVPGQLAEAPANTQFPWWIALVVVGVAVVGYVAKKSKKVA